LKPQGRNCGQERQLPVTKQQGNSIVLNAAYFPAKSDNAARNKIILNLIKLFEKNGEEYVYNLPLEYDAAIFALRMMKKR
jgi:hypothetical protein